MLVTVNVPKVLVPGPPTVSVEPLAIVTFPTTVPLPLRPRPVVKVNVGLASADKSTVAPALTVMFVLLSIEPELINARVPPLTRVGPA